jgi:hypothetical protein
MPVALYDVIVTLPALEDIERNISYIRIDLREPQTAVRMMDDIETALNGLSKLPQRAQSALLQNQVTAAAHTRIGILLSNSRCGFQQNLNFIVFSLDI